MKRTVRTGATLLLILLAALPATAQEPGRDPAEPASSADPDIAAADGAGRATADDGPETESPVDDAPGDSASGPGRSPFDYRPSEQISEDLSVSFPVDI
jgi:hypothetical protein